MGNVTNVVNIGPDDDAGTALIKSMWPGDIRKWASWHTLVVHVDPSSIDNVWCDENLVDDYATINNKYWCFKNENDRTLFKLRWLD